jgi:hypothetical protein
MDLISNDSETIAKLIIMLWLVVGIPLVIAEIVHTLVVCVTKQERG